jgi:hypothetical protein
MDLKNSTSPEDIGDALIARNTLRQLPQLALRNHD